MVAASAERTGISAMPVFSARNTHNILRAHSRYRALHTKAQYNLFIPQGKNFDN